MDGLTITREEVGGENATLVLKVNGELTIPFAGEFSAALLDAFDAAGRVRVNLEGVSAVDITGLQLLCSAHRSAYGREKGFGVEGLTNPILDEAACLAGFRRHVGCAVDVGKSCIWIGGYE
ncbi:STAS domain-containing protein [Geobacter hydrogenophilus]|uniref:Sulfate transporter n=1 Tax=Geobacter hydrogenophilus TaxID=40983 RepID=A0A9W6LDD9_9BACT|nr:STAS domain-containing protein [Geobacter hydrogenophilus]MBT0892382.1 STAS domain-containing protein [Geobacter hydrogenophilus]GLI39777.1 sulfate transporter [Geobacter hydrogenophilus]